MQSDKPGGDAETIASERDAGEEGANTPFGSLPTVTPSFYRMGTELARGGMGRILRAEDLRLKRPVAIKELLTQDDGLRIRFEREARITAQLQHPAIVPIHEAGLWPSGEPFYTMKLVSGRPLDQVIATTGTLADRIALLPKVIAVAEALAYAHSHHVIHRDLKPQNVLVGEFGETIVIDWGLAKDLTSQEPDAPSTPVANTGDQTVAGAVLGTPAYMPVEQAEGEPVDARADVYALGAILYHLLAKRPPYIGSSTHAVLESVLLGPPQPLGVLEPELPPDLVAIVDKAMARTPPDRYADASALVVDLQRFSTGQLVGVHRYSAGDLVRRWMHRHRTPLLVAIAALAVLLTIGVIAVWRVVDANGIARARADDAARALVTADQQRSVAVSTASALLIEQGRQELIAGQVDRASVLLSEAYRGSHERMLQVLLGRALAQLARRGSAIATEVGSDTRAALSHGGARLALYSGAMRGVEVYDTTTSVRLSGDQNQTLSAASANGRFLVLEDSAKVAVLWTDDTREVMGDPGWLRSQTTIADTGTRVVSYSDEVLAVWTHGAGVITQTLPHLGKNHKPWNVERIVCDAACTIVALWGEGELLFVRPGTTWQQQLPTVAGDYVRAAGISSNGKSMLAFVARPTGYSLISGDLSAATGTFKRADKSSGLVSATIDREATMAFVEGDVAHPCMVDVNGETALDFKADSRITASAFSLDGRLITANADGTIRVYSGESSVSRFTGPTSTVQQLLIGYATGADGTFVPNRVVAVTASEISIWPLPANADHFPIPSDVHVRFGSYIHGASNDGSIIHITTTDTELHYIDVPLSLDGTEVRPDATGTWQQADRWIASESTAGVLLHPIAGGSDRLLAMCHARSARELWVARDGSHALCPSEPGGRRWIATQRSPKLYPTQICDGALIDEATERYVVISKCHEKLDLFDTERGYFFDNAKLQLASFALSGDGQRIIGIDQQDVMVVVDAATAMPVVQLGAAVAVRERLGIVYSMDEAGALTLWDRERGSLLYTFPSDTMAPESFRSFDVSPDGLTIVELREQRREVVRLRMTLERRTPNVVAAEVASLARWTFSDGRLQRVAR